nr:hypothetical protein [Tanacetum cinerariifolium]
MEIFMKILAGKTISLDVIATTTIAQVKSATDDQEYIPEDDQISDKVDIPIDMQVLIFNEMVLHDSGTLADFHIKTESILTLMRKSRASMQIFVQPPGGSKFSLEVNPLHTIANLKAMVSEKQGIPTPDL